MIKKNFLDYPWHDADILSIYFDRSNPGKNDSVVFQIKWMNGRTSKLAFMDCY
jgi:hypothetical protein